MVEGFENKKTDLYNGLGLIADSTYDLTKKAESYLASLPEGHDLRFRVYSQIFVSGYQKK